MNEKTEVYTNKELKDYYLKKGYSLSDRVGISYLEQEYEDVLKGEKATYRVLPDNSLELVKEAKKRNIIVSYDSNYRAKLWSLDEASKFMKEVLPFVDIAFLGILDFKNILKYDVNMENDIELELERLYKELFKNYSNLKYMASTKRTVNSANNNSLQGFLFNGEKLEKSKVYTFDILDRVGGGDSFTAGVLHGLISDMKCSDAIEFATCASVLKHSIIGDINMVNEKNVTTLMKNGVGNINR